jgi:hypothetical protein
MKKIVIVIWFMDEKNERILIVITTMIGYGPGTQWEDIGYTE